MTIQPLGLCYLLKCVYGLDPALILEDFRAGYFSGTIVFAATQCAESIIELVRKETNFALHIWIDERYVRTLSTSPNAFTRYFLDSVDKNLVTISSPSPSCAPQDIVRRTIYVNITGISSELVIHIKKSDKLPIENCCTFTQLDSKFPKTTRFVQELLHFRNYDFYCHPFYAPQNQLQPFKSYIKISSHAILNNTCTNFLQNNLDVHNLPSPQLIFVEFNYIIPSLEREFYFPTYASWVDETAVTKPTGYWRLYQLYKFIDYYKLLPFVHQPLQYRSILLFLHYFLPNILLLYNFRLLSPEEETTTPSTIVVVRRKKRNSRLYRLVLDKLYQEMEELLTTIIDLWKDLFLKIPEITLIDNSDACIVHYRLKNYCNQSFYLFHYSLETGLEEQERRGEKHAHLFINDVQELKHLQSPTHPFVFPFNWEFDLEQFQITYVHEIFNMCACELTTYTEFQVVDILMDTSKLMICYQDKITIVNEGDLDSSCYDLNCIYLPSVPQEENDQGIVIYKTDPSVKFLKLHLSTFSPLVPLSDLERSNNNNTMSRIFYLEDTSLVLQRSSNAFSLVNKQVICADHGQEGTRQKIYRLRKSRFPSC
jgi:hypothetical protein